MTIDAEGTEGTADSGRSDRGSELSPHPWQETVERLRAAAHAAAVNRFCDGWDEVLQGAGQLLDAGSAETALVLMKLLGQDLEAFVIPDLVAAAREQGASWADVGEALGVSRQGARQRYRKSDRAEG